MDAHVMHGLAFRPRAKAWLWILPIALCGLILAGCNGLALTAQAPSQNTEYFWAFGILGLAILIAPIANFVNAEVRLVDGVVSKRGMLRSVSRWQASDLVRVHSYVRWMTSGDEGLNLDYVVYRFMLRNGGMAFDLSEAWWRTSDIEALANELGLRIPVPRQY